MYKTSVSPPVSRTLFSAMGLSLLASGVPEPAIAQTLSLDSLRITKADMTETISTEALLIEKSFEINQQPAKELTYEQQTSLLQPQQIDIEPATTQGSGLEVIAVPPAEAVALTSSQPVTDAAALRYPTAYAADELLNKNAISEEMSMELGAERTHRDHDVPSGVSGREPLELAQARRRTRATALGADYIGIGADIGYTDDFGFAAISKFSFSRRFAVRPSIVIGDDFSVLVPITYDFSQYSSDIGGFPVRPYAGIGASYTSSDDDDENDNIIFNNDNDDDSEINLLLSAGVDVPISRRFTLNGQVNWGVLDESQFGVTVGVGYNLGNLFSQ